MHMGIWVASYLAIGAIYAALMYKALAGAIKARGHDAELDEELSNVERTLKGVPGGVTAGLLATVFLWPVVLIGLIGQLGRHRSR